MYKKNIVNPNILFLVIDGLRSDKCLGPKKTSKTPNLDNILNQGIIFPNTICAGYTTIPSMSSIFTSLHAHECIINDNNSFDLNPNLENYISYLRNINYETFAFVPSSLNVSRLPSLFEKNVEFSEKDEIISRGLDKKILDYFNSVKLKKKWFCYLHIYDLYVNYVLELDENENQSVNSKEYGNNRYERILSSLDSFIGRLFSQVDLDNTIFALFGDHGNDRGAYTEEIDKFVLEKHHPKNFLLEKRSKINKITPNFLKPLGKKIVKSQIDSIRKTNINQITTKLEKFSRYEKRLIQHASSGESHVYDDRCRVPFVLILPESKMKRKINEQITTLDIFPTIFDFIGYSEYNLDAKGNSLLPLIDGKDNQKKYALVDNIGNSPFTNNSITNQIIGIRTNNFKYFRKKNNKNEYVHLFNLIVDPLEEKNVQKNHQEIIKELEDVLTSIEPNGKFELSKINLKNSKESEEAKKLLKDLGYI